MNEKELQEAFLLFLAQKSGAKNEKELQQYVKNLGEEGLKKAYSEFQEALQAKTKKAKHGAKLLYFKSLKHQCADDEELVYFKKGGSIGCGCKKKEQGGEIPKAQKGNAIDKFKNRKKDIEAADDYNNGNGYVLPNPRAQVKQQKPISKQASKPVSPRQRDIDAADEENRGYNTSATAAGPGNFKKKIQKKSCGSKFKKAFKNGGSLNGIPFIRKDQQ